MLGRNFIMFLGFSFLIHVNEIEVKPDQYHLLCSRDLFLSVNQLSPVRLDLHVFT